MLRKLKWQFPGEPLAARYNWCLGPVPDRGPAVEKHWPRVLVDRGVDEDWQVAEVYSIVDCRMERWNMTCSHDSVLYIGFRIESVWIRSCVYSSSIMQNLSLEWSLKIECMAFVSMAFHFVLPAGRHPQLRRWIICLFAGTVYLVLASTFIRPETCTESNAALADVVHFVASPRDSPSRHKNSLGTWGFDMTWLLSLS